MNKFSSKNIIKNLLRANVVSISPLEMIVRNETIELRDLLPLMSFCFKTKQTGSIVINKTRFKNNNKKTCCRWCISFYTSWKYAIIYQFMVPS